MKRLVIIFVAVAVSFFFLSINTRNSSATLLQSDSTVVKISIVGDLMCHGPEMELARAGKDSFNFKPMFSEVKKFFKKSDLTFGNLETTVAGRDKKFSGYPLFNSPDEFLSAIKDAGFNVLFTANNHTLDRGTSGIVRTRDLIRQNGMSAIGTFLSERDRDSIRIFNVRGIKIAVLAFTYGLNGNFLPTDKKFMVSVIDLSSIKTKIDSAKLLNADVVLVYFHFGEEYQQKANAYQKAIVGWAEKCGADIIIGSHPHVIQPAEFFKSSNSKLEEGLVVYSLGNFISNQRWRYSDAGVILNIQLTKNNGITKLSRVDYIPTWVFKGKVDGKNEFNILPSDTSQEKLPAYLSKSDRAKLLQSYNDVNETLHAIANRFPPVLNERK